MECLGTNAPEKARREGVTLPALMTSFRAFVLQTGRRSTPTRQELTRRRPLITRPSSTLSVSMSLARAIHTHGTESFWSMLNRAHEGAFHKIGPEHLNRYMQEFTGNHNVREQGTVAKMTALVSGLVGNRIMYRDLIADQGQLSGTRS